MAPRTSGKLGVSPYNSRQPSDSKHSISLNTSAVDVVDFAVARAHELTALRLSLRERSGTRRVYQTLSWHARRRTMSHSVRRMPLRLRAAHKAQLLKCNAVTPGGRDAPGPAGKRVLRKYRGRARFLKALRRLRLTRAGLLETHVWHAKRFAMRQLHNFRVAATCCDRGVRSAFRAVTRSCAVHDESYLRVAQVAASEPSKLLAILRRATNADDGRRIAAPHARLGERVVRSVVFYSLDSFPAGLSDVLYAPEGSVAWLWLRPEVADDVLSALEAVCAIEGDAAATWVSDMPGRFRILGPRAELVLKAAILWEDSNDNVIRGGARCAREGIVVPAMFKATALGAPKDSKCDEKLGARAQLWDSEARSEFVVRAARRTRDPETNNGIPALLLQRGGDCGYYGWDVIVPRGWCMPVWAALMNANGRRAIGIDEVHELQTLSNGGVLFPDEFVDCPGAHSSLKAARVQREQFAARRPVGKRPPLGEGVLSVLGRLAHGKATIPDRPPKRLRTLTKTKDKEEGVDGCGDGEALKEINPQPWRHFSMLRGTLALRSALGVIAGGTNDGSGCDNMFVAVALRAVLRGIPRRDAEVCVSSSQTNGDASRETIGVVLSGGYGLDVGVGVGRALVLVNGLRRAWEQTKSSTCKRSLLSSPSSASQTQVRRSSRRAVRPKAVPVVFRNVGANSPWRDAVLTVVYR